MKQSADLKRLLTSIDHKSYPAYKDVRGAYDFNTYILSIDHVQGDPFASPSKVSIQVRHAKAGVVTEDPDKFAKVLLLQLLPGGFAFNLFPLHLYLPALLSSAKIKKIKTGIFPWNEAYTQ